jgi:ferredoxin-NADP reductase
MPGSPAGQQGMMGGMEKMMEGMMGGGSRKEIYPVLMGLPSLTPETRAELRRLSEERIYEGTMLLRAAQEGLPNAIASGDHDGAERALQQVRDGIGRVDSGVAVHKLLQEGIPPQRIASRWFKRSMGLAVTETEPHGLFGLSWFHYVTMFVIAAFAATMIGMTFYRTQRAAALLTKLAGSPAPAGVSVQDKKIAASSPAITGFAAGAPSTPAPVHPGIAPSRPNSWTGPLLVARIFQETAQVKTFRLADPAGGKLPFNYLPGQFLTFTVTPHGQAIKRSYTIASSPTHRDYCEVTVRHEDRGLVSGYLHDRVHEGELLQVTAPSGKFTFAGEDASGIVLIAGGVGVTPMMSVVRFLTDRSWPGDVYLVYGCKTHNDAIYREEIEYLVRRYPNLHVTLVAESADTTSWPYATGRITKELLAEAVPGIASRHIHLCGPKPMMDAVKSMLAALGAPAEQVEIEVFIGRERPQAPLPGSDQATPAIDLVAVAVPPVGEAAVRTSVSPVKVAVATFARSNKTAALPPTKTVLEASEDVGVDIDYSCRVGTCGTCKVKLLSGTVTMEVDDALEPADKTQNIILACQAKSTGDVSVDA